MTGTIRTLGTPADAGVIVMDDGSSVRFEPASVLAYDRVSLAVGQHVTFEIAGGKHPKAVNVHSDLLKQLAQRESPAVMDFRFTGFDQSGSLRQYRFEWLRPGENRQCYLITADMGLFTRHRVGVQEGPALCLRSLMAHLGTNVTASGPELLQWSLSDADLVTHVASREEARAKPRPRRRAGHPE